MSDPTTPSPAPPPPSPPVSDPEGRRSSTATLPASDNTAPFSATASVGSSPDPPSRYPSSAHSSVSKAPPSVSGSRVTATSPPTTVSGGPGPASTQGSVPESGRTSTATMSLDHSLSSRDSQLHVAEARAALVATMSNMLDSELQSRASLLHANSVVLSRQERDVAKATDGLRKENDKLAKVVKDAGRKIKELGNVQNWAEVLERDFLVLEETMRLVRRRGDDSDDGESSCSECSGSYWSGSESEREPEGEVERGDTRLESPAVGRKGSVSRVNEQQGERNAIKERDKGKRLDSGSGSSTAVGGESTISSASPADSASNLSGFTHATVSIDQAILESLAEAMATDMRIGLTTTARNAA